MQLTKKEISCLENYHFVGDEFARSGKNRNDGKNRNENENLLCVRTVPRKYGSIKELDTVKRTDVTSWEIFKSHFGLGKLAGCDLRMKAIASHLASRSIEQLKPDSPAYQTIHQIASRVLIYRKEGAKIPELWQQLATQSKLFTIDKVRTVIHMDWRIGNCISKTKDITLSSRKLALFITPLTTFGHLIAQADLLEDRSFDKMQNNPTQAAYVGGYGENYHPWHGQKSISERVNEDNMKGVFFRYIAEREYFSTSSDYHFRDSSRFNGSFRYAY